MEIYSYFTLFKKIQTVFVNGTFSLRFLKQIFSVDYQMRFSFQYGVVSGEAGAFQFPEAPPSFSNLLAVY